MGLPDVLEGGELDVTYFALVYTVVEHFVERRVPFRAEHLRLADEAAQRGDLLLGGALGDPPDRALLIFHASERSTVEAFARADPYVRHGLVQRWDVWPWAVVVGTVAQVG